MNDFFDKVIVAVPVLLLVLILLAFVIIYVWSFIWLYKDAQLREKSGCIIVIVLFFFVPWPLGIIIWLVCRPNLRNNCSEYHRRNRLDDNFRE